MNRPSIGRAHLSIGEVLSLLQDEFPDVTISKIRFLESQGLLDPERTPSGYRKFYEYDIERLRWILRLQKDHYLPLKVIKDRLDEAGGIPPADLAEMAGMGDDASSGSPDPADDEADSATVAGAGSDAAIEVEANGSGTLFTRSDGTGSGRVAVSERAVRVVAPPEATPPAQSAAAAAAASAPTPPSGQPAVQVPSARSGTGGADTRRPAPAPAPRPTPRAAQPSSSPAPAARSGSGAAPARSRSAPPQQQSQPQQRSATPPASAPAAGSPAGRAPVRRPQQSGSGARAAAPQRSRQAQRPAASRSPSPQPAQPSRTEPTFGGTGPDTRPLAGVGFEAGADAVSLTLEELAEASGLTLRDIRDLERYGLVEPRDGADGTQYDGDALIVARTAAGFLQHGIEARHMRSYKVAVDREVGMFEQIVSPLLKQRNPEARTRATRTVTELIRLGEVMRGVLLRRELRDHIGGS